MASAMHHAMEQLHRLVGPGGAAAPADSQLLADFVTKRDEKAFEVLVWRHSGLVLGACERILRDAHAAEDAFQAVFLVFARKAASIGRGESLAAWLHRTAVRIALRSLAKLKRAAAVELTEVPDGGSNDASEWSDLRPVLDEEIGKLPEKYRVPIVLCYLEGQTNEAAAKQLGCPKGTVLSRLSRGRDWLKARLLRRGIALSAGAFASAVPASASTPLVTSTVSAAIPFAGGASAAGLVSPAVASLTEGALRTMFTPLKAAVAALLLGSLAAGATAYAARGTKEPAADSPVAVAAASAPAPVFDEELFFADDQPKREERAVGPGSMPNDLVGRVVAVNKAANSFSVEQPPKERGGEATKVEVKIGPKSSVVFNGVGLNGAAPAEGYQARVDLDDTKTTVKAVVFNGPNQNAGRGGGGMFGLVRTVKDKSVRLQVRTPGDRDEGPTELEVVFDAKTVITFSNVDKDGAKIAENMMAWVQLADGKPNVAGSIMFSPSEQRATRRDKRPEVVGKLASGDDKNLTIEQAGGRGEEPVKTTVKIGPKTEVRYSHVVAGGAKPTEGMTAQVWLADGSKDEAEAVLLMANPPQRWTTLQGRVSSAAADGSTITIEQPPMARGEEAKQLTIKLPKETKLSFWNVGPGEATPKEGYRVVVRLADDSKDTAAEAQFFKPGPDDGRRGR